MRPSRRLFFRAFASFLIGVLVLGAVAPVTASPDEAIMPLEKYTTAKGRSLAQNYRPQLLQLYDHIYHCLPWLSVSKNGNGIGFPRRVGAEGDDRYLSVWISVEQADDPQFGQLPLERRVSAMLSRYGIDMLRRMARLSPIVSDANVYGLSVVLSWLKPGTNAPNAQPVNETLALFIDKSSLGEFLAKHLAASEFLNRAKFTVFEGRDLVGRIPLEIWEDNFNSTFKLKNYELAKGKKC